MEHFKPFTHALFIVVYTMVGAYIPPKILFQSTERTVYFTPGQHLEIPCVAYGTPLPRYHWTLNGVAFNPSGSRIGMKTGVGTLLFQSVDDTDEGLYQCFAGNGIGTALSDMVTLRKAYIHDLFQKPVQVHQVYLDFPLILKCPVASSQPPATVHWKIKSITGSSQPLQLSNRVSMSLDGDLYFSNVLTPDAGNGSIYYCESTNNIVRQTVKSPGQEINVHGTTKHVFPVSLMWASSSSMVALEGQNATLKCIFSGNPTPDVYWSRANFSTLSPKAIQSSWGQELILPKVNHSDEGIYNCLGINPEAATPVIHQVNLSVESRPVWTKEPRDIEALPLETVIINCTAHGVPPPSYRWFINGVELQVLNLDGLIDNIEQNSTESSILTVHKVTLADQMNIQCIATNRHGHIFADIALNVRDSASAFHGNTTVVPSLCMDVLGMECAKIKATGHCNDAKLARFCRQTCNSCSSPEIVG